ncbi:MAG: glycosyltransferase [Planctomycetes bacterium]|nr:glycosyltransferase [Planctomycetota bacterium]
MIGNIRDRLLIVGNGGDCHVGSHFQEAAELLDLESKLVDIEQFRTSKWLMRIYWRILGRRDPRARYLKQTLLKACSNYRPACVLVTGRIPLSATTIRELKCHGATVVNFMTDDPWNPLYQSRWLMDSMRQYDIIFTPRHANIESFVQLGVHRVVFLPFAYSSRKHEVSWVRGMEEDLGDVLFVGGADADRVAYARAFLAAGFSLVLYGGLWDRYPDLRGSWRGIGTLDTIRQACLRSKVTLVLPRHANRDGHVMRSYESVASNACVLAEDTDDHREMFGDLRCDVMLFRGHDAMVQQARQLVQSKELRDLVRVKAFEKIVSKGGNAYTDRLNTMLDSFRGKTN